MVDCFVGAATGAFKTVSFKDSNITNVVRIVDLKPQDHEITAMCFGDTEQSEVVAVLANRQLKLYNALTNTYSELFTVEGGAGPIKGVCVLGNGNIFTAANSGELRIWTSEGKLQSPENWSAGPDLLTMAKKKGADVIATGGKENLLKLWDIETHTSTWSARNVKHDNLNVRVPIWDTCVQFLNDNEIVTGTGTSNLRVYDPRTQRKPIREMKYMTYPITAMSLCHRDDHVVISNTIGEVALIDMKNLKIIHKMRGFAGAVRGISAHPTEPYVVTVGIDRHIRLHNVDTKILIKKMFAKVQMNCVLLKDKNECSQAKPDGKR